MEQFKPIQINIETLKAEYIEKLKVAVANAVNVKLYDKFANYQLTSRNPIKLYKEFKEYKRLLGQVSKSRVQVETIIEFKLLLETIRDNISEIGMDGEWDKVTEILAHENAHANVGEKHSIQNKGYAVIFYEFDNKKIGFHAAAISRDLLKNPTLKDLDIMEEIMKAPETYGLGGELSTEGFGGHESDQEVLDYIKQKREELKKIKKEEPS